MKRKLLILLSVLSILFCLELEMSGLTVKAAAISANDMARKLNELKVKYPDQSYWNDSYKNSAWQCMGFACIVGDYLFGEDVRTWPVHGDASQLCIGDHVRYQSTAYYDHSIIITNIVGDTISFVDCNGSAGSNKVGWRQTTRQDIAEKINRYPLRDGNKKRGGYGYIQHQPNNTVKSLITDNQAPTIKSVYTLPQWVSSSGYYVNVEVTDNTGVTRVAFPSWTQNNGQDDVKWIDGYSIGNNTYQFYVNTSQHNFETGIYNTHVYAYDAAGNYAVYAQQIDLKAENLNQPSSVTVEDGVYIIRNTFNKNYCFDVINAGKENKNPVWMHSFNASSAQKIKVVNQGGGKVLLYPECANGNKVLDTFRSTSLSNSVSYNSPITQNSCMDIWDANDSEAQLYYIVPLSDGTYTFMLASKPNYVIGATDITENCPLILQRYINNAPSQKWYICDTSGNVIDPTPKISINDATVSGLSDIYIFNSNEQIPSITITINGKTLGEGIDYNVTYTNNVNVGTATVTITGEGNYTGSITKNFTITAKSIIGMSAILSSGSYPYDGNSKIPTVTISGLTNRTDYRVTYTNNINVGTATVTITGEGNYTGSITKNFTITAKSITGMSAILSSGSYLYDGNSKIPTITISGLTNGTDYRVTYTNNINVGTATVTITGKGNYTGSIVKSFVISAKFINGMKVVLSSESQYYDGSPKIPVVTIVGLTIGTDYSVAYSNNINVGTATVTITGKGNYAGNISKSFTIMAKSIDSMTAKLDTEIFTYNGEVKTPNVVLAGLKKGIDYTQEFINNINVGTATVIIIGKGNYTGSIIKNFTIKAKSIVGASATLKDINYSYDGTAKTPAVIVAGLKNNMDYTLTYINNINAGAASVVITGKGNYTGSIIKTFTIKAKSITGIKVELGTTSYYYDGVAKTPNVNIKGLKYGTDYIVTYKNNIKAGTATIIITGRGNYSGTLNTNFTIKPKSIVGMKVTFSSLSFSFNGKARTPSVTINGLKNSVDYTLQYKNNVKKGIATIIITGKGNYTGVIQQTFIIK